MPIPKAILLTLLLSGGQGAAATPVMTVTGNGQTIPNGDVTPSAGDHTDFGLTASLSTVTRTFNIAVADANLTGVSVALSGSGAGGYTITDQPDATINAGANSNFSIRYDALTPIVYAATVTISSNELDDVTFAITGSSLYSARVLAQSPFDYRKLDEGSGTSIADSSTNAHTAGTAVGITWDAASSLPMLGSAPSFDGTNDYISIASAGFGDNFNMDEFTIILWVKMSGAGVWTDGTNRQFVEFQRNASNLVRIQRTTTNGTLRFRRTGNATAKTLDVGSLSHTNYFSVALSVSVAGGGLLAAGDMRCYINGAEVGTVQTGNVASSGTGLNANLTLLGAVTQTPTQVHNGWLRSLQVYNRPMDAALLALMTV